MRAVSCTTAACLLAALLACAAAPAAAQQVAPATNVIVHDGTHKILWDLAYVPYERLQARCGELVQFRWSDPSSGSGGEGQTVALLNATSSEDALARCAEAEPLTLPTPTGEFTEELLTEGTYYFVEPTNCDRGQILVVEVTCAPQPEPTEEVSASGTGGGDGRPRGWSRGGTDVSTARANAAARAGAAAVGAPAPAPAAGEAVADGAVAAAPAPSPAAAA
ncbi:hypothetical protein COHA_003151 [Chlorella ohadii]|uniref:Phytocyanin domain-containing protein n=1 Tax=Chlorella ohadii TaxID=2649997 RepID=A0AAD5DRW5_9CHLO|nr:hypothetical protein COHA_003151 [Chlorella ohadii]